MQKIFGVVALIAVLSGFFIFAKFLEKKPTKLMGIESYSFEGGGFIPSKYTCDGDNINPSVVFSNIPKNAQSLTLIMEDPDAPVGTLDHWVRWNIAPDMTTLEEDNNYAGVSGRGSGGSLLYIGPCPPSGSTHRYFFKVYALDTKLDLSEGARKVDLLNAMYGHVLAEGEMFGKYQKQ